MAQRTFFGTLRLALLLAVLAFVALGAWLDRRRSTDWDEALRITVYPYALARDEATRAYVAALQAADFAGLEAFLAEEAGAFAVPLAQPMRLRVSHVLRGTPPLPDTDAGPLGIAVWSLRFRWWAWRVAANDSAPPPDIQLFALYHAGDATGPLPHSMGLSRGLMAIAHLFATDEAAGSNEVVLMHELLHTLGASDKYDLSTGQPIEPEGLGDARQSPRYPQAFGEIMAGRIAVSARKAVIPPGLEQMTIGTATAQEIGWLR